MSLNRRLTAAKAAKQDEFYTQYVDIQKEVEAYLEFDPDTFRDKVVYCNCDDPSESNFFMYFAANFDKLGLKRLISTGYAVAGNTGGVGLFLESSGTTQIPLWGDDKYAAGDFRSPECVELLKQSDIVVTNPPFSLFREYVAQLVEHGKKFLIIGNQNAITYKEIFPLIKDNKLWMGVTPMGTDMLFDVPPKVAKAMLESGTSGSNYRIVNGKVMGRSASVWFTNLDHGRRRQPLSLRTMAENLELGKNRRAK